MKYGKLFYKGSITLIFLFMMVGCLGQRNEPTVPSPTLGPTLTFRPPPFTWITPEPTIPKPTQLNRKITSTVLPRYVGKLTPTPFLGKPASISPGIYLSYWNSSDLLQIVEIEKDQGVAQIIRTFPSEHIKASPDGNQIVFMNETKGNFLTTYNIRTGEVKEIPQPDQGSVDGMWEGNWSPDGRYFAYAIRTAHIKDNQAFVDEYPNIYIADLKNNRSIQVTSWEFVETYPIWSPDGDWLAFQSDHAKVGLPDGVYVGSSDIFILDMDCLQSFETCQSASIKQLTNTGVNENVDKMSWSPDLTKIAFSTISNENNTEDIYLLSLSGGITNLTNSPNANEDAFAWSPYGDRLVIRDSTLFTSDLFLHSLTENTSQKITNSPEVEEGIPSWSPDGKFIAYDEDDTDPQNGAVDLYSLQTGEISQLSPKNNDHYNFAFWMARLPEMQIGSILQVSPLGINLNLRARPSTSSETLTKLRPGEKLTIIGGPVDSMEYKWWQVQTENTQGWIADVPLWYLP